MSPERGVLQLATCAVLNAIWDLWAKQEGKPLWKLVSDFSPEQFVRCTDFRYLTDVLTPEQALEMLREQQKTKAERMTLATENKAVPAYNTSAGWLGHSDDKVLQLLVFQAAPSNDGASRSANCCRRRPSKDSSTSSSRPA